MNLFKKKTENNSPMSVKQETGKSLYQPCYKCPLCGRMLVVGDPREIPYDKLPELLGMVIKNQMFQGNPYLYQVPLHIPCKCNDGSAGLAMFAGFRKIN